MQYISSIFFRRDNRKVLCEDERGKIDVYVECGESLLKSSKLIKRLISYITIKKTQKITAKVLTKQ